MTKTQCTAKCRKIHSVTKTVFGSLLVASLSIGSTVNASIVLNGGFESAVPNVAFQDASVANWFIGGAQAFVAIWGPGGADAMGAPFVPIGKNFPVLPLAGPRNSILDNGLPDTSPGGGNYLAADADPTFSAAGPNTVNQLINVIPGHNYMLSFLYAAAQEKNQQGSTQDAWQVSLNGVILIAPDSSTLVTPNPGGGSPTAKTTTTPVLSIAQQGFSGWKQETFNFIAPAGPVSQLLSFLAVSPNNGLPPMILLDAVSITATAVPEPVSLTLVCVALAGMGMVRRKRS